MTSPERNWLCIVFFKEPQSQSSLCWQFLVFKHFIPRWLSRSPQTGEIVLTEGTPLNVVTTQAITSKTANLNDVVNFKVDEDVVVNGQVVIRKGTVAIGSVMHATKGGYMGKSGKLGIQVESLRRLTTHG